MTDHAAITLTILYFVLAFLNGAIAKTQGRTDYEWVVLSLAFTPLLPWWYLTAVGPKR